ncbi:ATP-binding cassette domain-containing protein [Xinfangfangia sp. D13-10-4-6]|uniref:thiamine ABC transporter ATP-binding protein n=1 Tax=Pseudogemmobacter hezensis TaxID=2737662 RepID=UPI0015528366|nr:ATP-binding cassette domain-containing protein [Pseudogemmobacter hezensis]NPD14281.1 ATP-binding cassette domain-containing protein [Pseudogemmobacter hezensis]
MFRLDNLVLAQKDFRLTADWSIRPGAKVAVIGPSGAGKSSLLAAIAGFYQPVSGRVWLDQRDLTALPPGERPLSVLFQDQNLFPHLTLAQNLGLGIRPDLRLSAEDHRRIDAALERVQLQGLGKRKPAEISGGQASRAALARVLLRARPLLLLDEPFAALGPALKSGMLDLLAEVAAESHATVLMVTHDPGDALQFADETVLVADGVAHPPAATAALFSSPPEALAAYLGR